MITARQAAPRTPRTVAMLLALGLAGTGLAACGGSEASSSGASGSASASSTALQTGADGPVTNYQDASNWLKITSPATKAVDVFYVYPTAYSKATASSPDIADVTDAGMRTGAQAAYARQATAFQDVANIFAPYYRQADATYALTLPQPQHQQVIEGAPLIDVTAAFEYFLAHYNQGRPFMIVAHSQGSDVSTHLLATYLVQHRDVLARMIAAYIPGYSVTPDYLAANPQLRFGTGATDTGVLLSWNTEAPTIGGTNPVLLPGALVINPITWTRSDGRGGEPVARRVAARRSGRVRESAALRRRPGEHRQGCSRHDHAQRGHVVTRWGGQVPEGCVPQLRHPVLLLRHPGQREAAGRRLSRRPSVAVGELTGHRPAVRRQTVVEQDTSHVARTVEQPVGEIDHVEVVLDHDHSVALRRGSHAVS